MADLSDVFTELRSIMAPYAAKLDPSRRTTLPELYLDTQAHSEEQEAAVLRRSPDQKVVRKLPIDVGLRLKPELLEGPSPGLKKRMAGQVRASISLRLTSPCSRN